VTRRALCAEAGGAAAAAAALLLLLLLLPVPVSRVVEERVWRLAAARAGVCGAAAGAADAVSGAGSDGACVVG
jgi:hypothetical protein